MSDKLENKESTFVKAITEVNNKVGKEYLTDKDLILLASQSIARTYTYEEKGYK